MRVVRKDEVMAEVVAIAALVAVVGGSICCLMMPRWTCPIHHTRRIINADGEMWCDRCFMAERNDWPI